MFEVDVKFKQCYFVFLFSQYFNALNVMKRLWKGRFEFETQSWNVWERQKAEVTYLLRSHRFLSQLHSGRRHFLKKTQHAPRKHLRLHDAGKHTRLCSAAIGMEAFSSKDMAMKAQKKILSHMASKSVAHMFIDDNSSEVLDELYRVSKEHTGNRNEAQKVVKNMIKIAVKVGVLFRHGKFSADELSVAQGFRKKLHHGAMTAISFQEVQTLAFISRIYMLMMYYD